jgi:hypothetical protein
VAKVILRQKAIDDLNEIWAYTFENWSEKQADRYYSTLPVVGVITDHSPPVTGVSNLGNFRTCSKNGERY